MVTAAPTELDGGGGGPIPMNIAAVQRERS